MLKNAPNTAGDMVSPARITYNTLGTIGKQLCVPISKGNYKNILAEWQSGEIDIEDVNAGMCHSADLKTNVLNAPG